MSEVTSHQVISTILKHDRKVTSYKVALLRAINDIVLSFPDLRTYHQDVAIPLRQLAAFWAAYYWPFMAAHQPILQGQQTTRNGITRNDMAFRPALSHLRQLWEQAVGLAHPSDGFLLINELRMPRKQATYSPELWQAYQRSLTAIAKTLEMPIRYAGPGDWSVFEKPLAYAQLRDRTVAVPGTQPQDKCLVLTAVLWQTFRDMSLWVEALCIHEWCLFTERVNQTQAAINRGDIYTLLTARPDSRRPLTWEANNIDLLLLEGHAFICPWTAKRIVSGSPYDLDHLLPISVYPINELWNLVPADPAFNRHTKRDRLPTIEVLKRAEPRLQHDYECYSLSVGLAQALRDDVNLRFSTLHHAGNSNFSGAVASVVVDLLEQVAESRNLARF